MPRGTRGEAPGVPGWRRTRVGRVLRVAPYWVAAYPAQPKMARMSLAHRVSKSSHGLAHNAALVIPNVRFSSVM